MKLGALATIVMTVVGLCAIVFVFVKNSSPYVTIAQARESSSPSVHLAGDIDKSSLAVTAAAATFKITDEKGETTTVVFDGPPPANMGDATKVVAIGKMEGDHFAAKKLLLKCPSKYESEEGPSK